jgi:hypothetical protein
MEKLHVGLAVASIVAVLLIFATFLVLSGRTIFIS